MIQAAPDIHLYLVLHTIKRSQSQQTHGRCQHVPGAEIQVQTSTSDLWLRSMHLDSLPCGRDGVSDLETECHDCRWFRYVESILDDRRISTKEVQDLLGLLFNEQIGVDLVDVLWKSDSRVLPLDRAETHVRVLDVRSVRGVDVSSHPGIGNPRANRRTQCLPRTTSYELSRTCNH
jgi:hypothetical protein